MLGVLLLWTTAQADPITLHTRWRTGSTNLSAATAHDGTVTWEASRTAVVVCDMWDQHHCPDATERVGEMAPAMNEVLLAARAKGMLILHCPSDTLKFYQDHPGRKLAQAAPSVKTAIPLQGWCSRMDDREAPLPIDDSDGGCDGCPECPGYGAWTRQHPALEIRDGDAITDSAEAFYLMRQRGITNVIVMGVHINMCVLGRPFAIRQMVQQGQNVVLMRDMTDSMYNHRKAPYVSHFRGTELVVEHIERFWCPSITRADFTGKPPFRFAGDVPKKIVLLIGENEYQTWETLPAFAAAELSGRGYQVSTVMASPREGDPDFADIDRLRDADLVVVSTRRRTPPQRLIDLLKAHVAAGKPVVALRTASHGFDAVPKAPGYVAWPTFDVDVLGMKYGGHYNNKPPQSPRTLIEGIGSQTGHIVMTGVTTARQVTTSHLYKQSQPADSVVPLMQGRVEGQTTLEPVAWLNTAQGRRVFATSLGNPDDFETASFRRLLLNGILWCLRDPVPPAAAAISGKPVVPAPKETAATTTKPIHPAGSAASASTNTAANVVTNTTPPAPDLPQEAAADPLAPEASMARFRVADDLVWEQLLTEPQIAQPVFLNFDERGRMWVVEYRQYPSPAGLTRISRDSVWRSVYDKVPPPPPRHFPGKDRISIHEDTDGDGRLDRHSVFIDGLNIVTAVERGRGGVWVLNPPYLLFYRDANHDDVPDGDPEVRLSGFGLEDTHSVANSLRWGPDGWLYGAQGSTVTANIWVHGADGKPLNAKAHYSQGQNIWRYHPERRVYEVFSEGGGNAFGCEIDNRGRIFSGHNGGDTRGFHYQQGAYLQKGFEKHGPLSNPYAFGYFPAMAHDRIPRFTHNFVIYDHGALPSRYTGQLFGVEPLQGRIVLSEFLPEQSTFRTHDLGHPVTSDDRWFRPVDIKVGPDGALYVCDWYDQQVNHFRNHEGRMDAANGRVYRLKARGASAVRINDLGKASSADLIKALKQPNRWTRQMALRILADRRDAELVPGLTQALFQSQGQLALETLWALNVCGGWNEALAQRALNHPEAAVREWAVRLLGDPRSVSDALAETLSRMASQESDLGVRNQLACTARRLPSGAGLPIVRALAGRSEDDTDPRQPLLLWWAIENFAESDSAAVLGLWQNEAFWRHPLVEHQLIERMARRWAQAGTQRDLLNCARLFDLSPSPSHSRRLAAGLEQASKGRALSGLPEALRRAMARHGVGSAAFALRQGNSAAIAEALKTVVDETATRAERLEYLGVLAEVRVPGAVPALSKACRGIVKDDALRQATLTALAAYDDPSIAQVVLSVYPGLGPLSLPTAQALLASRSVWSKAYVQAIARKPSGWAAPAIPPQSVPPSIIRKIKQHRDSELQTLAEAVWPQTGKATSAELDRQISERAGWIRAEAGDPYAGRTLFQTSCGGCHRLFAQGGEVGPDLTVHDRSDIESLLLAILNPSAEIREGYENHSVETRDGRSLAGFLVEQNPQSIVLRGLDNQNVVLARSEIAELSPAGLSLMPEGLLDGWKPQQVRDLFAYLRSTQPLVGEPPQTKKAKP